MMSRLKLRLPKLRLPKLRLPKLRMSSTRRDITVSPLSCFCFWFGRNLISFRRFVAFGPNLPYFMMSFLKLPYFMINFKSNKDSN